MPGEVKDFFKYIFSIKEFYKETKELVLSSFNLRGLRTLFFFLTIITFFSNIYLRTVSREVPIVFLILTIIFHYRLIYLGGAHKKWARDIKGIPSRKELLRKEWSSEEGQEDPKIEDDK